jgi:hypothetical protein
VKQLFILLALPLLLWGDIFLIDGDTKYRLAPVSDIKMDETERSQLPRIKRNDPTITLQFEGEDYNNRHLNARLATLDERPEHTVLTEYSEKIAPNVHRVTFSGYRYYDARMLQVFYCGAWYAAMLEALEEPGRDKADQTAENATPDNQPSKVLSYDELDHLLNQLGR